VGAALAAIGGLLRRFGKFGSDAPLFGTKCFRHTLAKSVQTVTEMFVFGSPMSNINRYEFTQSGAKPDFRAQNLKSEITPG